MMQGKAGCQLIQHDGEKISIVACFANRVTMKRESAKIAKEMGLPLYNQKKSGQLALCE